MAEAILRTVQITKRFGGLNAVDNVDFDLTEGELVAVIGPNGAGKTTFVNLLAGALRPDSGEVIYAGSRISSKPVHVRAMAGIARSFQIASIFPALTVLENVSIAAQAHAGHSFRFWKPVHAESALQSAAMGGLESLGLQGHAHRPAWSLSHGERRLLEIAMALATKPRVLLLDEPMAGLGVEETRQMIEFIRGLKDNYTILLVEHDMDAVFALADRIVVLASGGVIAGGTPDQVRADPEVRRAYLGDDEDV
jgi:branched-chain amino acid transport system ATP-binding protein